MTDTSLTMRLALDAAAWSRNWRDASRTSERAAKGMRREFGEVSSLLRSIRGHAAAIGVSFGVVNTLATSAKLDKGLIGVKQTAGATTDQMESLRKSLFSMSSETGQAIGNLQDGFNDLIQSGQSWESSMASMPAINKDMAVTGASANTLAGALSVASEAFDFDLSKAGVVEELLDKMTVAGRLGNAELEDLSMIFGRVGVNAKAANLQFSETLGMVEQLSLIERQPERLATLMDSTLRIFNSGKYRKQVSQALGVSFFNDDGSARSALDVLDDIAAKYKALNTDEQRAAFITKGFGKTDLDTQRGLRSLLAGDALTNMRGMIGGVEGALGTINRDLPDALQNAVDQAGRLRTVLGEAADRFARPINKVFADSVSKLISPKEQGGFDLSGGELALGGLGIVGSLIAGKKYGGKFLSKLSGGALSTVTGVAVGKTLEATAGVTPVYVVNMPAGGLGMGGMGGGVIDDLLRLPGGKGARAAGTVETLAKLLKGSPLGPAGLSIGARAGVVGGALTAAGATGWGIGTLLNKHFIQGTDFGDAIGRSIAHVLGFFGNDEARASLKMEEKYKLSLEIESKEGNVRLKRLEGSNMSQLDLDVSTGHAMLSL